MKCLLCQTNSDLFLELKGVSFFRCASCDLVFKHTQHHLGRESEKERYATHENDPSEPGYQAFLFRLLVPLLTWVNETHFGLDYGCGPTKPIEYLLSHRGIGCHSYDPYFFPEGIQKQGYDFITCSEAAEHFFCPHKEFSRMFQLLTVKGFLAVMTQFYPESFQNWYYHRDPTHVVFYSPNTMKWIAQKVGRDVTFYSQGVVIFHPKIS